MRLNAIHVGLCALLVAAAFAGLGCPRQNATLRIVNDTTQNIETVNVSPSDDPNWGPNQISSAIPPGESRDITGLAPDTYDARVIVTNDDRAWLWEFVLSRGETETWTVTDDDLEPPTVAKKDVQAPAGEVEVYRPGTPEERIASDLK